MLDWNLWPSRPPNRQLWACSTLYVFLPTPTRQITSVNPFLVQCNIWHKIYWITNIFSITQIFYEIVIQKISHGQSEISAYLNICFAFCITKLSHYQDKIPNACRLSREGFTLTPSLRVQLIKTRKTLEQSIGHITHSHGAEMNAVVQVSFFPFCAVQNVSHGMRLTPRACLSTSVSPG